jgi:O-antigen/teichoic acid export membrane protein
MVTPEFYRAGQLIPLIILSVILLGLRNHFEFGILWSKKTKYYVYINAIMAVVNLVLNFILIWTLGLWGAVYSSIITIVIHNSLVYFFSKKQYFIKFEFVRVAKLLSVALAIYGVSLLITTESIAINIILKSMLVIVFPFALLWMKIITQEESLLLKKLYHTKIKPIVPLLNSKIL